MAKKRRLSRRWRVSLYTGGTLLLILVVAGPLAVRAAVHAAIEDLRKHEKLDAHVGGLGLYRAGVIGLGARDIEIRTLDGDAVASADALVLRPRIRSLRKRPGFWIGARDLRIADPALLNAGQDAPYDTARSALRTLHRNFSDSALVFRVNGLSVSSPCGEVVADDTQLRIVSRSPHDVDVVLTAQGRDRFIASGDVRVFRDSVEVSLTGSESTALFRIHSQTAAPGWDSVVMDSVSVSVVDETMPARAAPLAERLRQCVTNLR